MQTSSQNSAVISSDTSSSTEPVNENTTFSNNNQEPGKSEGDTKRFYFTESDIRMNKKSLLSLTYSQLLETFGAPLETKEFKINPPATETDFFFYYKVLVYDGLEVEFDLGEENRELQDDDTVFRFDITGKNRELASGLKLGMTVDEVSAKFNGAKLYDLENEDQNEDSDIVSIKHVLNSYKPENQYSEYTKAMILYSDSEKFEDPLAKALVLLVKDNTVDRIVFGYPTAD